VIQGPNTSKAELAAGHYDIYQDPGGVDEYPLPTNSISIRESQRQVSVSGSSTKVSPFEVASPLLGTGLYAPVASFTVSEPGVYSFEIKQPRDTKVFVAQTYESALHGVGIPLGLALIGVVAAVWCLVHLLRAKTRQRKTEIPS
jgi:hypothetical protein